MEGTPIEATIVKGMGAFKQLGVQPTLQKALKKIGMKSPTPVQSAMIPLALKDNDLIVSAYTGSGKTLAYLLPLFQLLGDHESTSSNIIRAVIIVPTRDLVIQIAKVCERLGATPANQTKTGGTGLRFGAILSDQSFDNQFTLLAEQKPDFLIATPGRLLGLILELESASPPIRMLNNLKYLIMDEADQLVEVQHREITTQILQSCRGVKGVRARWMISATMPVDLASLVSNAQLSGMMNVKTVMLDSAIPPQLDMGFIMTQTEMKLPVFYHFIMEVLNEFLMGFPEKSVKNVNPTKFSAKKTIVFVQSKHHVEFLVCLLRHHKKPQVFGIHGTMAMSERDKNMDGFRATARGFPILICTDVGARGVDVPDVDLVINYDFPTTQAQVVVHRAGRTARAGKAGRCLSILIPEEIPFLVDFLPSLNRHLSTSHGVLLGGSEASPKAVVTDYANGLDFNEIVSKLQRLSDPNDPSSTVTMNGMRIQLGGLLKAMSNSEKAKVKEKVGAECLRVAKTWLGMTFTGEEEADHRRPRWSGFVAEEVYGKSSRLEADNRRRKDELIRSFGCEEKEAWNKTGTTSVLGINRECKMAMERFKQNTKLSQYAWEGDKLDMSFGEAVERLNVLKSQRREDKDSGGKGRMRNKRVKSANATRSIGDGEACVNSVPTGQTVSNILSRFGLRSEEQPSVGGDGSVAVVGDIIALKNQTTTFEDEQADKQADRQGMRKWNADRKRYEIVKFDSANRKITAKDGFGNLISKEFKSVGKYSKWQKNGSGVSVAQIGVCQRLGDKEKEDEPVEDATPFTPYDIVSDNGGKERIPYEELTRDQGLVEAVRKNLKMTPRQNRKLRKIQTLWLKHKDIAASDVDMKRKGAVKTLMEQQRGRILKDHAAKRRTKMDRKKAGKSLAKKKQSDVSYVGGKSKITGMNLKGKFRSGFKDIHVKSNSKR
eukprot:GHVH01011531.1.p1 GENE.GHVH01011531.1~~GHVH01011531.1.p1  ORF type:complete len:960 (+),score=194.35 GHVH01011531.1:53-2881(+)